MSLSDGAPMMTMPVAPANSYGGGMGMWGENWIWIIVLSSSAGAATAGATTLAIPAVS